jgi:Uma2 family endonuclease
VPFQSGDMMDQKTFHALYEQAPPHVRAELIGGIVYIKGNESMLSPLKIRHGEVHIEVGAWLAAYKSATDGVRALDSATDILAPDSEPQPDAILFLEHGQTKVSPDGYLVGPPELVVEVALSSVSIDTHRKKHDYENAGVAEYLVLLAETSKTLWFVRGAGGGFELMSPDSDGIHRSRVFPGLWLDANALFRGDTRRVSEVLQQGLATSEHADFMRKLADTRDK